MEKISLMQTKAGQYVKIVQIGMLDMRRRFLEMGFVVGTNLTIIKLTKHSALVKRANTIFALDAYSASQIFVEINL